MGLIDEMDPSEAQWQQFENWQQPSDGDNWVTCGQGHTHWGQYGAAGLLLRHQPQDGPTRYLLARRGADTDVPGVWAPPSGARSSWESPDVAAIREANEELGPVPAYNVQRLHTQDHGNWQFHLVGADVPERFEPRLDSENEEAGWFTQPEVDELPLHPGFRTSWDQIKEQPGPITNAWQRSASQSAALTWSFHQDEPRPRSLDKRTSRTTSELLHRSEPSSTNDSAWELNPSQQRRGSSSTKNGSSGIPRRESRPQNESLPSEVPFQRSSDPRSEILDELSLRSVAHNLHQQFEQGKLDAAGAKSYAERLLKLIGYPPEDMNTLAALQAWQTLYPKDRVLQSGSEVNQIEAPPTVPTESWSYGTVSKTATQPLTCPHCGQPFHPNGWRGWTPIHDEGYGERTWQCPNCGTDMKEVVNRPMKTAGLPYTRVPVVLMDEGMWVGKPGDDHPAWSHEGVWTRKMQQEQVNAVKHDDGHVEMSFTGPDEYAQEAIEQARGELERNDWDGEPQSLRYWGAAKSKHLYHWTDVSDLEHWMDPSHTGPGHTYMTESGDPEDWNPDVPMPARPVRLAIDPSQLDPDSWDPDYEGWLGNHLYHGVIPPEAVVDVKPFPSHHERTNTDPTPQDAYPEHGDLPPDEKSHRNLAIPNDSIYTQ